MFHSLRYEDIWDRSSTETEDFDSLISHHMVSFSVAQTIFATSLMNSVEMIYIGRSYTDSHEFFPIGEFRVPCNR